MEELAPKYFPSPERGVEVIRQLLESRDWPTLTAYYNLAGSDHKIEEFVSGEFFLRREPPGAFHPALDWRYKHPFSPTFKYDSYWHCDDHTAVVQLSLEIDQGSGMDTQVGIHYFKMSKHSDGYQILPGFPTNEEANPLSSFGLFPPPSPDLE